MASLINKKILILDYGSANFKSIYNMLTKFSNFVFIGNSKKDINYSDLIILPGVGTFYNAMKYLEKYEILENLKKYLKSGNNIFGICLGMQILSENSEEIKPIKGLNIIKGFTKNNLNGPHIGWNKVIFNNKILSDLQNNYYYFQHSFNVQKKEKFELIGHTFYKKEKILSLIKKNNIVGTQFHPEKSQINGFKFFDFYFNKLYE